MQSNDSSLKGTSVYKIDKISEKYILDRYSNVKTNLIEITEDKLENIITKYRANLIYILFWSTPFSIILTSLLTLNTTEFKNPLFGLDIYTWKAIFIICIVISIIWLIVSICQLIHKRNMLTIKSLIECIKASREYK